MSGKVNTYTNHPAYQESIIRSDFHNMIRKIFGIVILVFGILIMASTIITLPLTVISVISLLFDEIVSKNEVFLNIFYIPLVMVNAYFGLALFQWGRHLTRPTSREFV